MVEGCGKAAPSSSSPDFGFLCVQAYKGDGWEHKHHEVLEGGYSLKALGKKCGDLWGGPINPFWQLVCTDCLRRAGYIW